MKIKSNMRLIDLLQKKTKRLALLAIAAEEAA